MESQRLHQCQVFRGNVCRKLVGAGTFHFDYFVLDSLNYFELRFVYNAATMTIFFHFFYIDVAFTV